MREAAFVKQNLDRWKAFEQLLDSSNPDPDDLADLFVQVTDDLAFSRTQYPKSKTTVYLNTIASRIHQEIYKNKKEDKNRFLAFWKHEVPMVVRIMHKQMLYALIMFSLAISVGAISAANDDNFTRLILGDRYVNVTEDNINNDDPMAIYKSTGQFDMFFMITFNNIKVSFYAFAFGLFISAGTFFILLQNGIMLGAFQYFFFQKGLFLTSFLTIWIHGTLEISAIVIAGGAGIAMGNSILFPGTYSRLESFKRGAKNGLKVIVGLIPVFIVAGFLESFVTRLTEMPMILKVMIIGISATFIVYYYVIYPIKLERRARSATNKL